MNEPTLELKILTGLIRPAVRFFEKHTGITCFRLCKMIITLTYVLSIPMYCILVLRLITVISNDHMDTASAVPFGQHKVIFADIIAYMLIAFNMQYMLHMTRYVAYAEKRYFEQCKRSPGYSALEKSEFDQSQRFLWLGFYLFTTFPFSGNWANTYMFLSALPAYAYYPCKVLLACGAHYENRADPEKIGAVYKSAIILTCTLSLALLILYFVTKALPREAILLGGFVMLYAFPALELRLNKMRKPESQ